MEKQGEERRRFKRIFFSVDDGISGTVELPESLGKTVHASIMDLGRDGMGLTIRKDACPPLEKGDRLKLKEILNIEPLMFVRDINMEIRWVLNHRSLEHIALGCQFLNSSEAMSNQIQKFIDSWEIK